MLSSVLIVVIVVVVVVLVVLVLMFSVLTHQARRRVGLRRSSREARSRIAHALVFRGVASTAQKAAA